MNYRPMIDRTKCNGCGVCVGVCGCQVLMMVDSVVRFNEKKECQRCIRWCTMCEMVCPTGAIQCPFEIVIEEKPRSTDTS